MTNFEKYLTGSHLIRKHFPDFRTPVDIDWIVFDPEHCAQTVACVEEFHYLPCSPHREMTPDEVYTLKVSHAIYDISWSKVLSDIRFLQRKGCRLLPEFLKELRSFWEIKHEKRRRTDFTVNPKDFFRDNVKRKIPHDDLHVLLNPSPSYKKMVQADSVAPVEDLYLALSPEEQDDALWEEAFVIGLERFNDRNDPLSAYHFAQRALVTRLHPVWLADHVINRWGTTFWTPRRGTTLFSRFLELSKQMKGMPEP